MLKGMPKLRRQGACLQMFVPSCARVARLDQMEAPAPCAPPERTKQVRELQSAGTRALQTAPRRRAVHLQTSVCAQWGSIVSVDYLPQTVPHARGARIQYCRDKTNAVHVSQQNTKRLWGLVYVRCALPALVPCLVAQRLLIVLATATSLVQMAQLAHRV